MIIATESQEQKAYFDWINIFPGLSCVYHIPNGGSRKKSIFNGKIFSIEGARLKRLGVRSGVSDIHIPVPSNGYSGLWIELKRKSERSKATKEQIQWILMMRMLGHKAIICRCADDAIEETKKYLHGDKFEFLISHSSPELKEFIDSCSVDKLPHN